MATKFYLPVKRIRKYYKWVTWAQPVLTSLTSHGLVTSSGDYSDTRAAWNVSDGIKSGTNGGNWIGTPASGPWWVQWKLPYKIKVSHIKFYNSYTYRAKDIQFFADASRTIPLTPALVAPNTDWGTVESDVNGIVTDTIFFYQTTGYSEYGRCGEIEITAQKAVESTIDDYDFYEDTFQPYVPIITPEVTPVDAGEVTYSSPGSGTFTVPADVIRIKVEVAGAGGGGSDWGGSAYYEAVTDGAAGGRGGLVTAYFDVTPGQQFPYVVGSGGARGLSFWADESYYYHVPDASPGGNSSFNSSIVALGGGGAIGEYYGDGEGWPESPGTSYGLGALGGIGGVFSPRSESTNGNPGWVKISYGGDIQVPAKKFYAFAREVV